MFSVCSERAVERWHEGERWFKFVRSMGQIFVAILAGVCSKEGGQLCPHYYLNDRYRPIWVYDSFD